MVPQWEEHLVLYYIFHMEAGLSITVWTACIVS